MAVAPDLTSHDFFLWDSIKNEGYEHQLSNLQELEEAIRTEIEAISTDTMVVTL